MVGRWFSLLQGASGAGVVFGILALAAGVSPAAAQGLTYASGQSISPSFEGWGRNPDGSFNLLFGYMNRNWDEEPDLPIGEDNRFSPGAADRGQPTHFVPRRNRFVFEVRVPADFGEEELIWTLQANGVERKAYGSLRPDYFVDNMIIMSETGTLGIGTSDPELRAHEPPVVELEMDSLIDARVGQAVTLAAYITDDGLPNRSSPSRLPLNDDGTLDLEAAMRTPSRITVQKVLGLHLTWFVYRGPTGWRRELQSCADRALGGHTPLLELSLGLLLGASRVARGWALGHGGHLPRARHVRAPRPGRRRGTLHRQAGYRPGQPPGSIGLTIFWALSPVDRSVDQRSCHHLSHSSPGSPSSSIS